MEDPADLAQLARERAFDRLDDAWSQALDSAETLELEAFLEAGDVLANHGEAERGCALLALLSEALGGAGRAEDALQALRAAMELTNRPSKMREELVAAYRAAKSGQPGFEAYLKLSKLEDASSSIAKATSELDDYLDFPQGRYVRHRGWGVGQVKHVESRTGALEVDFEKRAGHKLPIDGAVSFLERLPSDSFRARLFGDPEGLQALATENPGALVRLVVESRGQEVPSAQVRKDLVGTVVTKQAWTKLWTQARKQLTHDPFVEISGGARPIISIREAELRFADEVTGQINRARGFRQAYNAARGFAKAAVSGGAEIADDDRPAVGAALLLRLNSAAESLLESEPGLALAARYVLEDLGLSTDDVVQAVCEIEQDPSGYLACASTIPDTSGVRRYVAALRQLGEPTVLAFAAALPSAKKEVFRLAARALLEDAPALLLQGLEAILQSPEPETGALLELARGSFNGQWDDLEGAPPLFLVFEKLLSYADRMERLRAGGHPNAPSLRPRLKTLFSAGNFSVIKRYFEEAPESRVRHTYARLLASPVVEDGAREAARTVVAHKYRHLLREPVRAPWEDPTRLFTTPAGLTALQLDFERLVHEKIPENQVAIGRAAAFGDLSENAEYTAALEERDRLVTRADRLRRDLDRATLLEELTFPDGLVAPGTRVDLIDVESGEAESYTILGPWDVDVEHHVISYTAPLAAALLGRRVDEDATIPLPGGGERHLRVAGIERVEDTSAASQQPA